MWAVKAIRTEPAPIRVSAGRSYFQTNFSSRMTVDNRTLARMAVAALHASRVKSMKGRMEAWQHTFSKMSA